MSLNLEAMFPAPTASRLRFGPNVWPGMTAQSNDTLQEIVKDSQDKWHIFFLGDYRAHNHSVHQALALWAMGADDEIIKAAYKHDTSYLLPRFDSPSKITAENFNEHLGDDKYYSSYVDYFTEIVEKKGVKYAVEECVFSQKANFFPGKKDGHPEMVDRFMDGIIHSMIQVGYGLEFNIPGLVADGLAWTAVHLKSSSSIMPASIWEKSNTASPVPSPTSRLEAQDNVHALTILARMLKDTRFDNIPAEDHYDVVYKNITSRYSDAINEYVRAWTYDQSKPQELERKIEELVYANVLIYAVGGWSRNEEFNNDFLLIHVVTSAIFLHTIAAILTPASQEVLLRCYFAVSLTWWTGVGRPSFDLPSFFSETSTNPGPKAPFPAPHKDSFPNAESPKASSPNPWFDLIREGLAICDEHIAKSLRSLAYFAEIYGGRKAGQEDLKRTELQEAELIDGTLFVRAAILTMSKLRKEKDVDVSLSQYWGRKGFFKEGPAGAGVAGEGILDFFAKAAMK